MNVIFNKVGCSKMVFWLLRILIGIVFLFLGFLLFISIYNERHEIIIPLVIGFSLLYSSNRLLIWRCKGQYTLNKRDNVVTLTYLNHPLKKPNFSLELSQVRDFQIQVAKHEIHIKLTFTETSILPYKNIYLQNIETDHKSEERLCKLLQNNMA